MYSVNVGSTLTACLDRIISAPLTSFAVNIMSLHTLGAFSRPHVHSHPSCRSPAPFSVGLLRDHCPKRRRHRCAADGNGSNKQNVSQQLGDEVMQRLREAEKEAAELREQLAKAKAEAEVRTRCSTQVPCTHLLCCSALLASVGTRKFV